MNAITLRPDQESDVQKIRDALRDHQSVLFRAPCRYGKTVVSAYMAHRSVAFGRRVVFACHRDAILRQTSATFDRFGVRHGVIAAGRPANPFALAQVASADTLRNRLGTLSGVSLLVVDECHLWASKTRKAIIDAAREASAKIVGLSATPIRLDGKPLSDLFDAMVLGPTEAELIKRGSLASYRVYAPVSADMAGVHTRAGDYVTSEVEERLDRPSIVGDLVTTWQRYASGLRTVVYAISRAHGKHVLEAYLAAGVRAAYIDGETPKRDQLQIAHGLADGNIDVLVSVELLTTGYDLASLIGRDVSIQCVQLARPTKSLQLAIQMMMRCMTAQNGEAIILDHVNMVLNRDGTVNHGFPDDVRDWTLDGPPKRMIEGVSDISVWTCENCFSAVRSSVPVCPYCEREHTAKPRQIDTEDGELAEIKRADAVRKSSEMRSARDIDSIAALAVSRGYKPGFIVQRMKAIGKPVSFGRAMEAWTDAKYRWNVAA